MARDTERTYLVWHVGVDGWINDVLECCFGKNLIGLYLEQAINSVNVVDGNFECNGVGIVANSGSMVRLEGNDFESHGGPAIIVNEVSALTVRSNYFVST